MSKNEDITMEMAVNLALKMLLKEKKFVEYLEKRVEKRLENDCYEQPCTSSKSSSSQMLSAEVEEEIIGPIRELIGNLKNLTKSFEIVKNSVTFVNDESLVNHDAGTMFEAGLKVERICSIEIGDGGRQRFVKQIGCACRRLTHVMKQLAKKFTLNSKIHVSNCYSISFRLVDLCYTIAQQIDRYAEEAQISAYEIRKCQEISKNLLEFVDAFNVSVVEKLSDGGEKQLNNDDEQRNETKKRNRSSSSRRRKKFANCGQQVKWTPKHSPGTISKHILLAHNRGFLIDSTLRKARAKVSTTTTTTTKMKQEKPRQDDLVEADKNSPTFQTAAIISREIIEELKRQTTNS